MKSPKNKKSQQKKIERNNRKRKVIRKTIKIHKGRGKSVTFQLIHTINHFYPNLFDRIRQIEDYRIKSDYELTELITAGIAMYLFKEGSRNAFNEDRKEENFQSNYIKIFKMRLPHMDTVDDVMRRLDEKELERLKRSMVYTLFEKKVLHKFRLLGKWFLVSVDGTGTMSFSKRHCDHCLTQTSKNGKTTYSHKVLEAKLISSNGFSISLATVWIENYKGDYEKQDCELKAFKRLAGKIKTMYPRLPICITADGLYPNQTFFSICQKNNWRFIVTFKDGNLPSVWEEVRVLKEITPDNTRNQRVFRGNEKVNDSYCWVNQIPYYGCLINWIECVETVENTKANTTQTTHYVHVTNININIQNASEISFSGRLRWKIENEGFNTQKNLGYNLKHKYSRVSLLAAKNYYQCLQIAHLINQLLELSSKFKKLLKDKTSIKHLWKIMIGFLTNGVIDCEELSSIFQLKIQVRFE